MKKWIESVAFLQTIRLLLISFFLWVLVCSAILGQQPRSQNDENLNSIATNVVVVESHSSDLSRFPIVAAVHIVDFPKVRDRFEAHPLGRLLKSEALELFRRELADAGIESWQTRLASDHQLSLVITELAQRDLFTLVTSNSDQRFEVTLLLDTALDHQAVEQKIGQIIKSFVAEGSAIEAEIANNTWKCIRLRSHQDRISLGWTTSPRTRVCISSSPDLTEEFLNSSDENLHSVVTSVAGLRLQENLKPGSINWFWDPTKAINRGIGRENMEQSEKEPIEQIPASTEFSWNWETIACMEGNLELLPNSESVVGSLIIKMSADRNAGLFQLLGEPHDYVSSKFSESPDLTFWARVHWNSDQLLHYLSATYDHLTETPDAFMQTLDATKQELGVDLEKDLFSNLSPDAQVAGLSLDSLSSQAMVFIFDIEQPHLNADRIAKILHRLFAEDPESQSQVLRGYPHPLWKIKLDFDSKQMEMLEAGAMVVGNQFWCSSSADVLIRLLKKNGQNPTSDSSGLQQLEKPRFWQAQLDIRRGQTGISEESLYSRDGVLVGFLDIGRSLGPVYTLLKDGGVDAVEAHSSPAAQCMMELLKLDDRIRVVDFKKLPDYRQLKSGLGEILFLFEPHADGWQLRFEHRSSVQREDAKGSVTE